MAQPKPLFIPWLQARIDSGKFPGVQWTNPGKTEFSVPWKHALRQDSSSTDVLIFKAWAEVSGNGQAQGDPSVWKRNFRSTLRAKHFTMVTNNSNETANPLKVFRWPVDGSSASSPSTSSFRSSSTSATATPPLESQEEEELSYPVQERNPEDTYVCFIPNGESVLVQDLFNGGTLNQDDLDACLLGLNIQHQGTTALPNVPPQPFQELSGPGFDFQPQSPLANRIEGGADSNPSVSGEQVQMVEAQFMESLSDTLVESQFKTHFRVSVFYRGVKVSENLVTNEAGFKLVYRPQMTIGEVDPQTGLTLVTLPQPPDTFNPMQRRVTQQVLDGLGAGVDVVASGSVVYSSRRGDTKAFWSHSKFNHGAEPQEVAKTELQGVFLLQDFVKGMIDFTEGGDSPSCCLYICLGEKWPDHRGRAWEKKLVMVEVVFTSLETLKEMAEIQGASSLQSVELQISLTEMMEIC